MGSSDDERAALELAAELAFDEGKVVTYKLLSQKAGISSSDAQRCATRVRRVNRAWRVRRMRV